MLFDRVYEKKVEQCKKIKRDTSARNKGITLIALVVTIIVLLILAGISISTLTGQNGILNRAQEAKEKTEQATEEEKIALAIQAYKIGSYNDKNKTLEEYLIEELDDTNIIMKFENGKTYLKSGNKIIITYENGSYSINEIVPYTLINNESTGSEEKGFLIDIDTSKNENERAISKKDIVSVTISTEIPINYSISYDVSELQNKTVMLYAVGDVSNGYSVTIVPTSGNTILAPQNSSYIFSFCSNLKSATLGNLDTSYTKNMSYLFRECLNLENLDISNFNTSKVTDMNYMFHACKSLETLDVSKFDTSNVESMEYLFSWCQNLEDIDISNFNTSKVTNMYGMFNHCTKLQNLQLNPETFNTSNVKSMKNMFYYCEMIDNLNISNFNTSNVENMQGMFYGCSTIQNLDLSGFDTSNVSTMNTMFAECYSLSNLDLHTFNTEKVKNMAGMFYNCTNLTRLNLENFNTDNLEDIRIMFSRCSNLVYINLSNANLTQIDKNNAKELLYNVPNNCEIIARDTENVNFIKSLYSNINVHI